MGGRSARTSVNVDSVSAGDVSVVVGGVVGASGVAFLGAALARLLGDAGGPVVLLLGAVLPALLSAATAVAGYAIARADLRDDHALRVAAFWLAGVAVAALMAVAAVLYQRGQGIAVAGAGYMVVNNAVAGGLGGLLVGTYNVGIHQRAERLRERTRLLATERERARSRGEQLEMLNRLVSHDLRNDLNVIRGRTDLALEHVDDEGREHLEVARRSVEDGIDLTGMAGEFVETLGERGETDLEAMALSPTLRDQIRRLERTHPDATVDAALDGVSDRVLADDLLDSVFRNLLVNAAEHGGGEIAVGVTETEEGVVIDVTDDGPGVPDDRKDEIFGRGERAFEGGGTGLGLYLVDRIVSRYGGAVWVEDAEGGGATFRVRLRRA